MNTIGTHFRFTSFGESHGVAIGGVIDGCPAGVSIDFQQIATDLSRRRGEGLSATTSRKEPDEIEWLSGIKDGQTLGTPIAFMIRNKDVRSEDYEPIRDCYRPGHADFTYEQRYGVRDWRGGGRASARETAARVVAGCIARQLLTQRQITIISTPQTPDNQDDGNTYGGIVECIINGLPAGVGNPIFGRLNAMLAAAMMSIPSAIGFEMGSGFQSAQMTGREFADQWNPSSFPKTPCKTNHCGGIQGGISNGMPIVFRIAFHPVATQTDGMECIDNEGRLLHVVLEGRHDRCHVLRVPVIVESMAALVLADALYNSLV